ncbi:MAG: putative rane protein [Herbinix sp.]|nr:putative rane protein [Herbinix sp.]
MIDSIYGYLSFMTLLGFAVMGIDKRKAKQRAWRIPEKTLFAIAFLGGGIGSLLGMYVFHHKTKHKKFVLWLPVAALLYLVIILRLFGFVWK